MYICGAYLKIVFLLLKLLRGCTTVFMWTMFQQVMTLWMNDQFIESSCEVMSDGKYDLPGWSTSAYIENENKSSQIKV